MAYFSYKAKTAAGMIVSGSMEGDNDKVVGAKLRAQKLQPVTITPEKRGGKSSFKIRRVTVKDLAIFSRQFSTMIGAGVPVLQSLNIISEQVENKTLKEIVIRVRDDIGQGSNLSDALGKYPTVFSNLYVNMIRAGESAGILEGILARLAGYLEKDDALARKIKSALMYPTMVMTIAFGITIFLLVAVIPTFKTTFESFGHELPMPTKVVIGISEFMQSFFKFPQIVIEGVIVAGAVIFLRSFLKTKKGQLSKDKLMLKLPLFGMLIRKVAVAKFARTLGTLIKSGVAILEALDITARTSGNLVIEEAILKARSSIKEGENITQPLRESGIFPPMVVQMVSVGEETGSLDDMLMRSADFYDDEVNVAVAGLMSMIEPLIMAFLGVVIGGIVIAMFMPMMSMGEIAG